MIGLHAPKWTAAKEKGHVVENTWMSKRANEKQVKQKEDKPETEVVAQVQNGKTRERRQGSGRKERKMKRTTRRMKNTQKVGEGGDLENGECA